MLPELEGRFEWTIVVETSERGENKGLTDPEGEAGGISGGGGDGDWIVADNEVSVLGRSGHVV
jgi:hypothetical protein